MTEEKKRLTNYILHTLEDLTPEDRQAWRDQVAAIRPDLTAFADEALKVVTMTF